MNVGLISLGCSKNLVDSEMILGLVKNFGATIVNDLEESDIIIINTCGFIEAAKEEAVSTILDCLESNKKIVVTGCLVERYFEELKKDISEVDLYIPIKEYYRFNELIAPLFGKTVENSLDYFDRVLTTEKHIAYVKISEGCNNSCHFCAIPLIRGRFASRELEDIYLEVKSLVKQGVKEIVLISQDTTRYGVDLKNKSSIVELLKKLEEIEGIELIRVLYLYPEEMTQELIDTIANSKVIAKYFDMPIQHASNKVLKLMNRRDTKENIKEVVSYIRKNVKDAIIRTTIIVGYPGETEEDFNEVLEFIKEVKFDRLGAFAYSKEEGTYAYNMPNQVDDDVKDKRLNILMNTQENIAYSQNQLANQTITKVVIESYDEVEDQYLGRDYRFAPDDIDGGIFIKSNKELEISKYYDVVIDGFDVYNLYGKVV